MENQTINVAKYCKQLKRPELTNRRGVTFQYENSV